MAAQFRRLQKTYGFSIVNGQRSIDAIGAELKRKMAAVLNGHHRH
jgi:hypothetical protein